ncbi:MAG TPA: hypothetical protein VGO58_03010 [Chitinophagaceae bacterium]|jgi:cytosine/adenosine deaminase-related metal-dependent hydrolase|nr:hypothetical protein [Chitinophagaceae bacterium]
MVLHDVMFHEGDETQHLLVRNGIIESVSSDRGTLNKETCKRLEFDGAIFLPGFVNSHDHLDFNCYPQLGNRIYSNYTGWGPDIQSTHAATIKEVQSIPLALRIQWGLYKNLFNGFTTVVNHGAKLDIPDKLIDVIQECSSLHSPAFEKNWKWKLNNPFNRKGPVIMHMGEGTDKAASDEIDEVIHANKTWRKIVAVHGVAMKEEQAEKLAGLVWCPASNYFLLNKTAPVDKLKKKTTVVFGTDSTLTAAWNCREHFQLAMKDNMITEKELLAMLAGKPAGLWKIKEAGTKANLLVVKKNTSIFNLGPEDILLVMQNGQIRLIDEMIGYKPEGFTRVHLNDTIKYVQGDPAGLAKDIKQFYPELLTPFG